MLREMKCRTNRYLIPNQVVGQFLFFNLSKMDPFKLVFLIGTNQRNKASDRIIDLLSGDMHLIGELATECVQ